MSRKRVLVQGSVLSGSGIFVSMAAMLVVAKLITNARGLGVSAVGAYGLVLVAADFLNILSSFGLWVALPKLVASAAPERRSAIIGSGLGVQIVVSGAVSCAIYALWWLLPEGFYLFEHAQWARLYPHLWLLPPLFFIGTLRELIMAALVGLNRYALRSAGLVGVAAGQVILVYLLVWRAEGGLASLIVAFLIAHTLTTAGLYAVLPTGRRPVLNWPVYRESIAFSWPLYINQLQGFFYQRLDTVLIAGFLGLDMAGIYEMAKRLPMLLSRVLGALLLPYLPNLSALVAEGDSRRAGSLLNQTAILTAFTGYAAALLIVLLQEPVILLLFNAEYLASLPALGLLLVAICLAVQAGLMGQGLIALGHPKAVAVINAGLVVLSVGANVILLPRYGLAGAGWAALVAVTFSNLLQTAYVSRHGIRVNWGAYWRVQGFMALGFGLSYAGETVAWRLLGLAVFTVLCFAGRVITVGQILGIATALLPKRKSRTVGHH